MTDRMPPQTDTALICGQGALPGLLAIRAPEALLVQMEGFPADLGDRPVQSFRLERLVPLMEQLLDRGITRVCFAGAVRRPRIEPEFFDARTATLVPRILTAMQSGDDAALREVIAIFEDWGLSVVAAHDIAPDLLASEGVLAGAVTEADRADAARAAEIVTALGALDLGQGAVVAQGLCLAVETLPGTDAMLAFVAERAASLRPNPKGARGVLYKAPKPGQDRRIDLPAIGPDTIRNAAAAGLAGIAIAAEGVLILDHAATVAAADAAGLFLWARA